MNPKDIHEIERAIAGARDTIPPLLWCLYQGCVKEGFTETQALDLAKALLASIFRPADSSKGDS